MKGGGGEKLSGGGGRAAMRGVRFESQRFRLLSIVVGCFLISATFLLSSRPEATVFHTLSPGATSPSLQAARTPAMKTVRSPSTSSHGRDFLVDVVPRQQGGDHQQASHGDGGEPRQSADDDRSGDKTEWIKDTVITQETTNGGESERAAAESERNAAAGTADSGDEAAPGGDGDGDETAQGNAVLTTAAATTTNSSRPRRAEEKEQGGARIELREAQPAEKAPESKETTRPVDLQPLCDFSDFRTNVCDLAGDVRMDANASAFVVVGGDAAAAGQSHKVRPYPRKGDETCMGRVAEIAVRTTADAAAAAALLCTARHSSPAVVFSIGGYTGNIFHDFSDVIVPLFNTVHRYAGDVQLVMANVAPWWLVKYDVLLRALSRHRPLDLAKAGAAGEVHCFPRAVVNLRAHRELIIERERSPDGLATPDFTRFLRRALSLPRDAPASLGAAATKPRLVIISRRRTRLLLNLAAVVALAEEVGFEAVVSESDVASDIGEVGRLINSGDVLLGVHGAGLTNMVFLPPAATMVQVVPWGGLQWVARMDYGEPAEAMGLRYIQYEVAVGESSLKDKYPPEHEVFTNPTALHKKGFGFMRQTLMDGQDITIDLHRFRPVLLQALNNLSH